MHVHFLLVYKFVGNEKASIAHTLRQSIDDLYCW